jgi:hypothetical protein
VHAVGANHFAQAKLPRRRSKKKIMLRVIRGKGLNMKQKWVLMITTQTLVMLILVVMVLSRKQALHHPAE